MSRDSYNITKHEKMEKEEGYIRSQMIPMRDGTLLQASLHLPSQMDGPLPVLLVATPYNRKEEPPEKGIYAGKKDHILIILSWRGTAWSNGAPFRPVKFARESDVEDMEDFFHWLEKQPFFNGNCAMYGGSYPGYAQWCAQKAHPASLKATAPAVAPLYSCQTPIRYNGGAYMGSLNWVITMHHRTLFGYENVPDYNGRNFNGYLPLIEADEYIYGESAPGYKEYILTSHEPANAIIPYREEFKKFHAPAFISGGWFDPFKQEVIESYLLMKKESATLGSRKFTRLTMGPWGHGDLENGDIFGEKNDRSTTTQRQFRFLHGLLADPLKDPLPEEEYPVTFFMTGENAWYHTRQWPPEGNKTLSLYLHSGGSANSCRGDGLLDQTPPCGMEKADQYTADPNDPISPSGGAHAPKACYDRLFLEESKNMLVYTTEKFTSPLTTVGNYRLRFYASSSTIDTDFFATLTLLTPEGKSLLMTSGMIRARYRNGLDKEEFLLPHKIYPLEIDLGDMACRILPGFALRLELHGQEFPLYERNSNSGKKPFTDKELFPSIHTIYHDKDHIAELILPVNDTISPA